MFSRTRDILETHNVNLIILLPTGTNLWNQQENRENYTRCHHSRIFVAFGRVLIFND